jgi:hypothetical protein
VIYMSAIIAGDLPKAMTTQASQTLPAKADLNPAFSRIKHEAKIRHGVASTCELLFAFQEWRSIHLPVHDNTHRETSALNHPKGTLLNFETVAINASIDAPWRANSE